MLKLETHLEGMFAVNLGEVISDLESGTDLVRGQESVAAQGLQPLDTESRQSAILILLGDAHNTKLSGKVAQIIGSWRDPRSVKIAKPRADFVNHA